VAKFIGYFSPPGVTARRDPGYGPYFTDKRGRTLYTVDLYTYIADGRRSFPDGNRGPEAAGREFGTKGCERSCLEEWQPFQASATAQPNGYWSIVARDDGTRQWSFRGYAVYVNRNDKGAGDLRAHNQYSFIMGDGKTALTDTPDSFRTVRAHYWRVVTP
jgi:predicted lipoprotein with Yx(FWY)xxD motif